MTMTAEQGNEIIQATLGKAVKNGFKIKPRHIMTRDRETGEIVGYEVIIFDRDFARAIWPGYLDVVSGRVHKTRPAGYPTVKADEYHLQNMVLADNRLAYLEGNT